MSLEKDIREMEEAGFDVTVTNSEGKIVHKTNLNTSSDVCDSCKSLRFLPDPDPYDWFCDDDLKAVCTEVKQTIEGALRPYEAKNICRPIWCPHISEEALTDEQKERVKKIKASWEKNK